MLQHACLRALPVLAFAELTSSYAETSSRPCSRISHEAYQAVLWNFKHLAAPVTVRPQILLALAGQALGDVRRRFHTARVVPQLLELLKSELELYGLQGSTTLNAAVKGERCAGTLHRVHRLSPS